MKRILFIPAILLLMMAGSSYSCGEKGEEDIDMSNIDFNNIENLYEQPLPVIKKAVQGRWKVYSRTSNGDTWWIDYPQNSFEEINDNRYICENDGKIVSNSTIGWKKKSIALLKTETIVLWDIEKDNGIMYFESLKNDTLAVFGYFPDSLRPLTEATLVRIK